MKLRIHGNSIRLRLTKSDVARFASDGRVEQSLNVGSMPLVYGLAVSNDTKQMSVERTAERLMVLVSPDTSRAWTGSDQIAMTYSQPLGDGAKLDILVEKEFPCAHDAVADPDLYADLPTQAPSSPIS